MTAYFSFILFKSKNIFNRLSITWVPSISWSVLLSSQISVVSSFWSQWSPLRGVKVIKITFSVGKLFSVWKQLLLTYWHLLQLTTNPCQKTVLAQWIDQERKKAWTMFWYCWRSNKKCWSCIALYLGTEAGRFHPCPQWVLWINTSKSNQLNRANRNFCPCRRPA